MLQGAAQRGLSGPISRDIAIVSLRYPLSRDTFSAIPAIPQQDAIHPPGALFYTAISVRYPILQHIARYLCDTPGKQAQQNFAILSLKVFRKIRAPIKIKSALPPPPPKTPPQNAEFYGHGFSCRKNAFFQASIKLAQPFPAPELRTRILRTRGFF